MQPLFLGGHSIEFGTAAGSPVFSSGSTYVFANMGDFDETTALVFAGKDDTSASIQATEQVSIYLLLLAADEIDRRMNLNADVVKARGLNWPTIHYSDAINAAEVPIFDVVRYDVGPGTVTIDVTNAVAFVSVLNRFPVVKDSGALFELGVPYPGETSATVCWAASEYQYSYTFVEVGTIYFYGPEQQTYSCHKSEGCSLEVTGRGLEQEDRITLAQKGDCSVVIETATSEIVTPFPSGAGQENDVRSVMYHFGVLQIEPGVYSICWTVWHDDEHNDDHSIEFATIDLYGPEPIVIQETNADITYCVMGKDCEVEIVGYGLICKNEIALSQEACGVESQYPYWAG